MPIKVEPPLSARKYWTRRGLAEWLVENLTEDRQTLVGIDHAFSFPIRYFESHGLPLDWQYFLDDFCHHWPTDDDHAYVDFVRDGAMGNGAARSGNSHWRRLTEQLTRAKSVFHFDVPGQVAKSTHAGLPWLRFIRTRVRQRVHFWPFDGWDIPAGRSVMAEVYPALWSHQFVSVKRHTDEHDAYCIAAWMRHADQGGELGGFFNPPLAPKDRATAQLEGWILGVPGIVESRQ